MQKQASARLAKNGKPTEPEQTEKLDRAAAPDEAAKETTYDRSHIS